MPLLPDLAQRLCEPEVMDDPALDQASHHAALRGLARINLVSGVAGVIWKVLQPMAPCRVLDIATGGGDVPVSLWRRARRAGLEMKFAGCDASARAVAFARGRASRFGADIHWFTLDALRQPIPDGYDAITASLFLHHLSDAHAQSVLREMARAARRVAIVSDLERGAPGYLTAGLGCRLLTRSPVVHADGPRSVRAAFTTAEVRALAECAGLAGAVVERHFPWRWLLVWRRP